MKLHISLLSTAFVLAAVNGATAEPQKVVDVKVSGSGKPVILIPGLASPGEVWADTVKHLQSRYQYHVVTIAGYVAREAVEQNFRSQNANAKQARFRFYETAKHFIMIDDPAGFHAALDQELAAK